MSTLWFIIYMTVSGWQVTQIPSHPGLVEQCHFNNRGADFCIVSVEIDAPSKRGPSRLNP